MCINTDSRDQDSYVPDISSINSITGRIRGRTLVLPKPSTTQTFPTSLGPNSPPPKMIFDIFMLSIRATEWTSVRLIRNSVLTLTKAKARLARPSSNSMPAMSTEQDPKGITGSQSPKLFSKPKGFRPVQEDSYGINMDTSVPCNSIRITSPALVFPSHRKKVTSFSFQDTI